MATRTNNPLEILETLDGFLTKKTELVIFGKAALVLGFANAPAEYGNTRDVDGIIPLNQLEAITEDTQLWEALDKTNDVLQPKGLYITHLFEETQTILRPCWQEKTVNIPLDGLKHLNIKRPATVDLILTKMMRGRDPQDLADIGFLLAVSEISIDALQTAMDTARVPDVEEIKYLFAEAKPAVLNLARKAE